MITIIGLVIASVFVLFLLHLLSKNDFVLLRKNVSLYELFDAMLITMAIGLFTARLFFVLDTQNFSWFNPFRFFHLVRLPGLSFYGFILGVIPFVYFILRKKKVISRVYDILSIALIPIFIVSIVVRDYSLPVPDFVIQSLLFFIGVTILSIVVKFFHNYTLRDGSIALIIICLFSIDSLLYAFTADNAPVIVGMTVSQCIAIPVIIASIILFVMNQKIIKKKK